MQFQETEHDSLLLTDDMTRMADLSKQGFCCSQILLIMGLESRGKSNPDLVGSMEALCTGLSSTGGTCGVLTGGACLLGLYAGRGKPTMKKDDRLREMVGKLVDWFREEYGRRYGGITCTVILADPIQDRPRCPQMLAGTYQRIKEILIAHGFDLAGGES